VDALLAWLATGGGTLALGFIVLVALGIAAIAVMAVILTWTGTSPTTPGGSAVRPPSPADTMD